MAESALHARHDPLRVAGALDRGARLSPVLDLCARCRSLYTDLLALTTALPMAALPLRRREFTLSADDARRLRSPGWRDWWSAVGSARDAITKPLAIGFTTLGLAGLLLTSVPALVGVGGYADAGAGAAVAPEVDRIVASPLPTGAGPATLGVEPVGQPDATPPADDRTDPSGTLVLSMGLLAAGGGLFLARRVATRGRPVR